MPISVEIAPANQTLDNSPVRSLIFPLNCPFIEDFPAATFDGGYMPMIFALLVGGLEHVLFFRGVGQPPTSIIPCYDHYIPNNSKIILPNMHRFFLLFEAAAAKATP